MSIDTFQSASMTVCPDTQRVFILITVLKTGSVDFKKDLQDTTDMVRHLILNEPGSTISEGPVKSAFSQGTTLRYEFNAPLVYNILTAVLPADLSIQEILKPCLEQLFEKSPHIQVLYKHMYETSTDLRNQIKSFLLTEVVNKCYAQAHQIAASRAQNRQLTQTNPEESCKLKYLNCLDAPRKSVQVTDLNQFLEFENRTQRFEQTITTTFQAIFD